MEPLSDMKVCTLNLFGWEHPLKNLKLSKPQMVRFWRHPSRSSPGVAKEYDNHKATAVDQIQRGRPPLALRQKRRFQNR